MWDLKTLAGRLRSLEQALNVDLRDIVFPGIGDGLLLTAALEGEALLTRQMSAALGPELGVSERFFHATLGPALAVDAASPAAWRIELAVRKDGRAQGWLAAETGISLAALKKWLVWTGQPTMSAHHLHRFAAVTGVSADWLVTGKGFAWEATASDRARRAAAKLADVITQLPWSSDAIDSVTAGLTQLVPVR